MDRRDESTESLHQIIAELRQIIAEQAKTIEELKKKISILEERLAERERSLDLNSTNSGKPPSSDGFKKQSRIQSLREKSGKKPGGQPGHKGATHLQVDNPDVIEQVKLESCPDCNVDLSEVPVNRTYKRQVIDIPEVKPMVTELHIEVKHCPGCKKTVEANKDGIARAPVQYGPKTRAVTTYLNAHNLIPLDRTSQIMNEFFGMPMSEATIEKMVQDCAANVKPVVKEIEAMLKTAPVKGSDESSVNINGKTSWLHTLCNDRLVYYRISEKRGDITKDVTGTIVHDHFVSYHAQLENVNHAMCNAHHLRELKAVFEIDKESWGRDMARLLRFGNYCAQHKQGIDQAWIVKFTRLYHQIILKGLAFHAALTPLSKPSRGRFKRRPGHNLLLRLQSRADDTLRFLSNPEVPFTNNMSEQSLRMIKGKQKTSGCFRTTEGADNFIDVRSYTATAQKQGFNVFSALVSAAQKTPFNFAQA